MVDDDNTDDVTKLPDYDDRVLLELSDLEDLGGSTMCVVTSDSGKRVALDIRFDTQGPERMLEVADALVSAGKQWRDDYYDLYNPVDPDGEER